MTKEQIKFFEELTSIQEYCVNVTLSKVKEYRNVDELLNGITNETIYRIMELLDGYENELIKCNVTNIKTGNTLNSDIEMQDMCADVLACSDI